MSVLDIELFYFGAVVRIDDPSVGQDPIYVENHHPDGQDPLLDHLAGRRYFGPTSRI